MVPDFEVIGETACIMCAESENLTFCAKCGNYYCITHLASHSCKKPDADEIIG
jgi:hypothetical protein